MGAGAGGDLVRLTLFDNRFRDLIDFDPMLFATSTATGSRARGVEIEGRWAIGPASRSPAR